MFSDPNSNYPLGCQWCSFELLHILHESWILIDARCSMWMVLFKINNVTQWTRSSYNWIVYAKWLLPIKILVSGITLDKSTTIVFQAFFIPSLQCLESCMINPRLTLPSSMGLSWLVFTIGLLGFLYRFTRGLFLAFLGRPVIAFT